MDAESNGNLFDNVEPHRHLPGETRAALLAACERVRHRPAEFADAVAWLDGGYSEAAMCERHLKDSENICRRNMWELRQGLDPCDTFPRRKALRRGTPRAVLVEKTIGVAQARGMRLRGEHIIISNDLREDDAVVDAGNVETAWRSMDEKCRQHIRHIKDERRQRDDRIRRDAKDRMGRFLEAVRDAVKGDILVVNRVECSRRLVLLAAMIAAPESLSLSAEFGDMPWETQGNMLGIGGPYVPGRETLLEKHDCGQAIAEWSIGGFGADGFGNLIGRAMKILTSTAHMETHSASYVFLVTDGNRWDTPLFVVHLPAEGVKELIAAFPLAVGAWIFDGARPSIRLDAVDEGTVEGYLLSKWNTEYHMFRHHFLKLRPAQRINDETFGSPIVYHFHGYIQSWCDANAHRHLPAGVPAYIDRFPQPVEELRRDELREGNAEVESSAPPAAAEKPVMSKNAKALAALAEHPEWADTQIAHAAGCHVKSLYRFPDFVHARKLLREGRQNAIKGSKDGKTGDVEAWDDNNSVEDDE